MDPIEITKSEEREKEAVEEEVDAHDEKNVL